MMPIAVARTVLVLGLWACFLADPAMAGPYEDARTAWLRGEYRRVLEIDPSNAKAYTSLDRLYSVAGDWPALEELLARQVDQIDGERAVELQFRRAYLYAHRLAEPGRAVDLLEEVIGRDRQHVNARALLEELITPRDDGNDGLTNPASLAANIPVEVAESEFPIRIERYGLVPGSGGEGRHRGGLAVERVWRCLTPDTSLIVRSDRSAHPPYGLHGGRPGALSSNLLIRADGTEEVLPSMFSTTIQAGDVFVHRTAGGGGWGDPAERDRERIEADRADGKVA